MGYFLDLLRATAESPAMLYYLDNWRSSGHEVIGDGTFRWGLNENYARELLEVHTLGVGQFTEKDVHEVARCFTGWTIRNMARGTEYYFGPQSHDSDGKMFLGIRIPPGGGRDDGLKVLAILASHPATARLVSTKLAQRFVSDSPPQQLIDKMTRTFLNHKGDLTAVMEVMFSSREFLSQGAFRAKFKSPLEMAVSSLRALNANVDCNSKVSEEIGKMGQPLYQRVEPMGYTEESQNWLSTASLLARINFALALSSGGVQGVDTDWKSVKENCLDRSLTPFQIPLAECSRFRAAFNALEHPLMTEEQFLVACELGSPEFVKK
jgi:uncharacterized protein (DUF1800 family)